MDMILKYEWIKWVENKDGEETIAWIRFRYKDDIMVLVVDTERMVIDRGIIKDFELQKLIDKNEEYILQKVSEIYDRKGESRSNKLYDYFELKE